MFRKPEFDYTKATFVLATNGHHWMVWYKHKQVQHGSLIQQKMLRLEPLTIQHNSPFPWLNVPSHLPSETLLGPPAPDCHCITVKVRSAGFQLFSCHLKPEGLNFEPASSCSASDHSNHKTMARLAKFCVLGSYWNLNPESSLFWSFLTSCWERLENFTLEEVKELEICTNRI